MAAPNANGFAQSARQVDQLAQEQMARSRAPSSNPWAQQFTGPDGSIQQQFTGPMGGANQSLMGQALRTMGSPMDFGQYNAGTGDQHRADAIGAAQGQMNDWFGGMQGDANAATKQSLLNQGYSEGSPEYQTAMERDTGWGNDMQSSINNAAIGLGTQGGAMRQSMDMQAQQQKLAEALRERSMPMDQLERMQGLTEGSGPRQADDSELQGAVMDADQKYNDYWAQRGRAAQDSQNTLDSIFGVGSAALSAIPYVGGLLSAGSQAAYSAAKPKRRV